MRERLQKILSSAGVCSRRASEELLREGRVKVNGLSALLGDSADPDTDEITLDDRPVTQKREHIYLMLNKPRGYVTTLSDEAGRKTVLDLIPEIKIRVFPIGRLDMHSEGLLIMTDDGDLFQRLTHPSHEIYKEYLVRLTPDGDEPEPPETALSRPLTIDGQRLLPAKVRRISTLSEGGYLLTIAIREGKNRQIRRMCTQCGYTVNSLKRVAEGNLKLGDLPTGKWRYLTEQEVKYLKSI
ncbi:MAG: pseudouridine synthase [Clostridiaceae bacterium]|nr:pseudouridine synthase [Clostridiaceae bacterium]